MGRIKPCIKTVAIRKPSLSRRKNRKFPRTHTRWNKESKSCIFIRYKKYSNKLQVLCIKLKKDIKRSKEQKM